MKTVRTEITSEGIARLRNVIEDKLERKMRTPVDFTYLSDVIFRNVKMTVSVTTLKRVWGYISDKGDKYKPTRYTVCALAKLVGFNDYESFIVCPNPENVQPNLFAESIDISTLLADDVLSITWSRDSRCRLKYIDEDLFDVIETRNAKMNIGDRVQCTSLNQSAPLYLSVLNHPKSSPTSYIIGTRNGVKIVVEKRISIVQFNAD